MDWSDSASDHCWCQAVDREREPVVDISVHSLDEFYNISSADSSCQTDSYDVSIGETLNLKLELLETKLEALYEPVLCKEQCAQTDAFPILLDLVVVDRGTDVLMPVVVADNGTQTDLGAEDIFERQVLQDTIETVAAPLKK